MTSLVANHDEPCERPGVDETDLLKKKAQSMLPDLNLVLEQLRSGDGGGQMKQLSDAVRMKELMLVKRHSFVVLALHVEGCSMLSLKQEVVLTRFDMPASSMLNSSLCPG